MTVNNRFEGYKIKRELVRSGRMCKFLRWSKNEFGEPDGEPEQVGEFTCLYHEQTSSQTMDTTDGSQTVTKKLPMLLLLWDDAKVLQMNDRVVINDKVMKIVGVENVSEWNIVADISLEVTDESVSH